MRRNVKHNKRRTPEYAAWSAMLNRCTNPQHVSYPRYGGRGVVVCDRWYTFALFIADMGERPSSDYSLDRINPNGAYEPGNVRWADRRTQARNRRNNHIIEFGGHRLCLTAWAQMMGLAPRTLRSRLARGWSVERSLMTDRSGAYCLCPPPGWVADAGGYLSREKQ